ncbi:MAG: DUF1456 family protein [Rectinemataceae bacterium]|nr:DUF1456 family protein [Rectinemataceae bacterium]
MTTNDILKRIRYAVKMNDETMLGMIEKGGVPVSRRELDSWFLNEEDEGYAECDKVVLSALLDGMIVSYRGVREELSTISSDNVVSGKMAFAGQDVEILDNNLILKKIRIALELKEEDLIAIMQLSNVNLSKNELTALFRKKGHKNYRECMDQFLRNFLAGLAKYRRSGT